MGITKNIGKNTIGDNNKMSVNLHEYNMSTHDLSTIVRNTQSPGTLVPNLILLVPYSGTSKITTNKSNTKQTIRHYNNRGRTMESSKPKLFTCIPRNKRFCKHGRGKFKNRIQKRITNTSIL